MSETKVFKKFSIFLNGLGFTPKNKTDLKGLKKAYPNEWAIFSEGELGQITPGLCIYCGESTKSSANVCAGCDLLADCDYYKMEGEEYF